MAEPVGEVKDLSELLHHARIPPEATEAISREVAALGAVHVRELGREDWRALQAWASLREMERRRIFACVPP